MYQPAAMKKGTLLILAYALFVMALIVSIKLMQAHQIPSQAAHESLFADCGDPPPTPSPGE